MNPESNSLHNILKEKAELDSICKELGLADIKYFPSPKEKSPNIGDLTKHATAMLKIYQEHQAGNVTTGQIKEIFTED
jgi:hypothetical protein